MGVQVKGVGGGCERFFGKTGRFRAMVRPASAFFGYDNDMLKNRGEIVGDVDLGNGADTYDGRRGNVDGAVSGGFGDDTYIVDDDETTLAEVAGQGTDEVRSKGSFTLGDNFENLTLIGSSDARGAGNAAQNEITGNAGDNRLSGRAGQDTINGGDGEDRIFGGGGVDVLSGEEGDDLIKGRAGGDEIDGGDGEDLLIGNGGQDTIGGGEGADVIRGGRGKDFLTGGEDTDHFVYRAVKDSLLSARDWIYDFEPGGDKVDLSGLIDGELVYRDTAGFTGTAPELRIAEVAGRTDVYVDTDGNGATDMAITLLNVTGVSEDDFIL